MAKLPDRFVTVASQGGCHTAAVMLFDTVRRRWALFYLSKKAQDNYVDALSDALKLATVQGIGFLAPHGCLVEGE